MSGMSRRKGQVGERELAAELSALTGWTVKRRVRQHQGDSDLEGMPGWAAESKRHATATRGDIAGWWQQAADQAERAGALPALFYRLNRQSWRAVWPLSMHLDGDWKGYDWTVEGSLEAWAAVARELHEIDRSTFGPVAQRTAPAGAKDFQPPAKE